MKKFEKEVFMKKRTVLALLFLSGLTFYHQSCVRGVDYYEPNILATHFNGEQFVGSKTCLECHLDVYKSHLQSAHFNTSAEANSTNIKGSFDPGSNRLDLREVAFEMKKEGKAFYQSIELKNSEEVIPPKQFDIIIGSGIKGQSYLTWEGEKLFQLQTSYNPASDSWINSPGFPQINFERPIRDGCLKCHVTFATNLDFSGHGNKYNKAQMVYGVDCERCHRPSAKHVIFHRHNPDIKTARFMLKLDTLSRQKRLDICAQCHSGTRAGIIKGNSFSYLAGENLNEYSRNFYTGQQNDELDVHSNQYGLLTSSQCFKQSAELDCTTCHDPHKNQRGNILYFNQKCIDCHSGESTTCTTEAFAIKAMGNNCTGCHMPVSPSRSMSLQLSGDSSETPVYIRSHHIGIYPKVKFPMN